MTTQSNRLVLYSLDGINSQERRDTKDSQLCLGKVKLGHHAIRPVMVIDCRCVRNFHHEPGQRDETACMAKRDGRTMTITPG